MEFTKVYWFQKKGKNNYSPINWKGWALFAFVIGMVVSGTHLTNNPLIAGLLAAVFAGIGYYLIGLKRAPDDVAEMPKIKTSRIIFGAVLGMSAAFVVFILIFSAELWYEHSTIGPMHTIPNSSWVAFHSLKDNFDVQLPSYPQFQAASIPNAPQGATANTYKSDAASQGTFVILVVNNVIAATSTSFVLNSMYQGYQNDLISQGAQILSATSSMTNFGTNPAISFTINASKDSNLYETEAMYVLGSSAAYGLVYGNSKSDFKDSDFQTFVNSFHFDQASSTQNATQ